MNARKVITLVAVAVLVASAVKAGPADPVIIPDPGLKAAVEAVLGPDPTEADMASLHVLSAEGREIVDLTGIEYATNLYHLQLQNNKIVNISPLAGLTRLEFLNLIAEKNAISNQIEDITPLAGLTNIEVLKMNRNLVSDVSPLSGLTKLWRLELHGNQISDIDPLAGLMNLTHLELNSNQISTIGSLGGLTNLNFLNLTFNQISDIGPLAGLTSLTYLALEDNNISDVSPLSGLTNLTTLLLRKNQISDISALSGMTNLTNLSLGLNQISDISTLSGMTLLTELDLLNNQISDISALSGTTLLTKLLLNDNQISDISALSGMSLLTKLAARGNQISDISALSGMTLLTDLSLHFNQIDDISALSEMALMTNLSLNHNEIDDINPLIGLTNLEELGLRDNEITDIGPLLYMTHLTTLSLDGNPGSWEAYCIHGPIILSNNPGINLTADPNPYKCAVLPAETPVGTSVPVTPEDNTYPRTSPVTLTFETVDESGGTTLVTSESGPTPPTGFELGDPPTYYDITTSAVYTGLIAVCIDYSGVNYTGPPEALRLFHYDDTFGDWVDCTDSVDTENQLICGVVSSLSTFAVVQDVAPPIMSSISVDPDVLWPANHKMVEVTVTVEAVDNSGHVPMCAIVDVECNEAENGQGDGNTEPDWLEYTDDPLTVLLRAERAGDGDGRIYSITVACVDPSGNVSSAETVEVTVPHDQGKGKKK